MKLHNLVYPGWDIKSRRLMSVIKNIVKLHMDEQDRRAEARERREKWVLSVKKKKFEQKRQQQKLQEQERLAELHAQQERGKVSISGAGSSNLVVVFG